MSKVKKDSNQSLVYKGDLNIQIKKGNKIIKTKKIKNSGRYPLFQFFVECLNGNYEFANSYRPQFLQIFNTKIEAIPLKDEWETSENKGANCVNMETFFNDTNKVGLRTFTFYAIPDIELDPANNDQIGSASITYKFLIPFSHIKKDTNNKININCLALYSKENINTLHNPSTYVFIADDTGKKFENLISGIDDQTADKDFNIYIEWKLNILNSTVSNT